MSYTVKPNPRCLRGLHLVFSLDGDLDAEVLVERLLGALGPTAVHDTESWPGRLVHIIIFPFRAEFRIGERDREVSLLHRHGSNLAHRAEDRALLEELLSQELCLHT